MSNIRCHDSSWEAPTATYWLPTNFHHSEPHKIRSPSVSAMSRGAKVEQCCLGRQPAGGVVRWMNVWGSFDSCKYWWNTCNGWLVWIFVSCPVVFFSFWEGEGCGCWMLFDVVRWFWDAYIVVFYTDTYRWNMNIAFGGQTFVTWVVCF